METPDLSNPVTRQAYEAGVNNGMKLAALNPPNLAWTEREWLAIQEIADLEEISPAQVLRQAIRCYQLIAKGHSRLVENNPQAKLDSTL